MTYTDFTAKWPHEEIPDVYEGLAQICKLNGNDDVAILTLSKLDLDTDGLEESGVTYEPTHQNETSLDPAGNWLDSNTLPYIVVPLCWPSDHPTSSLGCLCTVLYGGAHCHAVVGDFGPSHKFGEGSLALHRTLGFERIVDGKVQDCGIDSGVTILFHTAHKVPDGSVTAELINQLAEPLFEAWANGSNG